MNDVTTAPEVNVEPETTVNDEQETTQGDVSVADLHQKTESKKPDSVPLARLSKEVQRRKEAEAELRALRAELEVSVDEDGNDDEPEVKKLAQKLERLEGDKRQADLNAVFEKNFNQTLANLPEYKDIVNVEVIRQMAFNPANANKTYRQLLDEAYGNAVTGRRTIETTTPRGGAKDEKVDMDRARTDGEYRREVLANPDLRKQYNEGLTDRVFR
jgi:hypothetical protein